MSSIDVRKFLLVIFILIMVVFSMPKITIKDSDIKLNLNEKYLEPGYKATYFGFDITPFINIKTNLDNTKVGDYEIVYELKYLNKIRKVRHVKVLENKSPIISLVGGTLHICPGIKYIEPGYTAYDNYDGDITYKVMMSKVENGILYKVYDTSFNMASVKREVYFDDINPPKIDLEAGDVYLSIGEEYKELGYTAYDNCLGDITSEVKVFNDINISKPGKYIVSYEASDGVNKTIKERNVYVTSTLATLGTDNTPGVIYLTFDDGPSYHTERLLNILDKYGVKATFFVVPKNSGYYYLIKRAYDSGHSIGIHSMSHSYSTVYASVSSFFKDVESAGKVIQNITGEYPYLYRYPGGSSNTVSRSYTKGIISITAPLLHEYGYHYFDWNISSGDANGGVNPSYVTASNVTSKLSLNRPNVVLMHDIYSSSVDALESIIKYGISHGYTFAPISMNTREVHHGIAN